MVFCNRITAWNTNPWMEGHNPYFNRWFSAIKINKEDKIINKYVTILILIDGFLQLELFGFQKQLKEIVTILILIDGFLQ